MRALGADVLDVSATYRNIRIRVGMGQIEAIAALPDVTYVQPKHELVTSRREWLLDRPAGCGPFLRCGCRSESNALMSSRR